MEFNKIFGYQVNITTFNYIVMRYYFLVLLFIAGNVNAQSQNITPHPVPEEFSSDYYDVTVNGESVPVFHAGLNVYFVSFDFTDVANVTVKSKFNSNSYSGHTYNKATVEVDERGYWRGKGIVRPLSKGINPQLDGLTLKFSVAV